MAPHLQDKTFFITGGAQGMGKAYTQAALADGARVFFGDINSAAGEETLQELVHKHGEDRVKFKAFDVSDKDAYESAFNEAVSVFGCVDFMVNNAGIIHEGQWEKMIEVNLKGVINGSKLAAAHMRKDKGGRGGRIINISSEAGLSEYYMFPIYTAVKSAVRSYTTAQSQQPDLQAQGLEYAIICPGLVNTGMVRAVDEATLNFTHYENYNAMREAAAGIMTEPEEVAQAFLRLVSLTNMNGAILLVNKEGAHFKKMVGVDVPNPDGEDK